MSLHAWQTFTGRHKERIHEKSGDEIMKATNLQPNYDAVWRGFKPTG